MVTPPSHLIQTYTAPIEWFDLYDICCLECRSFHSRRHKAHYIGTECILCMFSINTLLDHFNVLVQNKDVFVRYVRVQICWKRFLCDVFFMINSRYFSLLLTNGIFLVRYTSLYKRLPDSCCSAHFAPFCNHLDPIRYVVSQRKTKCSFYNLTLHTFNNNL